MAPQTRITFEELALLCHLSDANESLCMSHLAEYQKALRPTITHRINHLVKLGYIERLDGEDDHRNICCSLSPKGIQELKRMLGLMRSSLKNQTLKDSISLMRLCNALDSAGALSLSSAELILVALYADQSKAAQSVSVGELSAGLGMLQPTVSMAVGTLKKEGLIERVEAPGARASALLIALTKQGEREAHKIAARVAAI